MYSNFFDSCFSFPIIEAGFLIFLKCSNKTSFIFSYNLFVWWCRCKSQRIFLLFWIFCLWKNTINKVFICKGCTFLFPLTCLFCSNKTKSLICLYSRLYCFLNFFSIERNMEERSQKNPYFLLLHYFVWCTMGETILDRTIFECRSTENVQFQIFNLNFYPLKITNMYFSNVLLLLMHDWFGQTWIPIKTRTNFSYLFWIQKGNKDP